ncbi:hypothetical protein [Salipiger sp.]|uniref:hypothetical protein n=1 Tax=Salipiger sp. TaxID=2078585 RepID=UPI003A982DC0
MTAPARFALAFCATVLVLSAAGFGLARLLLPPPLTYYHSSYLSLSIPEGWWCAQEGTEFVCNRQPDDPAAPVAPRKAVIIFTAKIAGPQDTFDAYRAHLLTPRTLSGEVPATSTVEEVTEREIAGRRWIVGRHFGSELPNYRTWYFATVSGSLAVLVTFAAHRDVADDYAGDIDTVLRNLALTRPVAPDRP